MEHLISKLKELINTRLKDGKISADIAIDTMLDFYKENKIIPGDKIDNDMLLFQYGISPFRPYFYFDLTRQIADPNNDEFLQIHLTLNYYSSEIGAIESYNRWSITDNTLDEFHLTIKNSDGYKRVKSVSPLGYEIEFDKV